jgi:hypothetical protein
MTKFTTDKSITHFGSALENDVTKKFSTEPRNLTEVLRRTLIDRRGEAGALGMTWMARDLAEQQAAQFCDARPRDCVASATGDYHARVYELPSGRWGIVVWYDAVD